MPIYDWLCSCGARVNDHYSPLTTSPPPTCPRGEAAGELHPMERVWSTSGNSSHFQPFVFDMNGTKILIDSTERLRHVERESEKQFKAGQAGDPKYHGARPFAFRHYSQDPSNRDVGLFGRPPHQPSGAELRTRRTSRGRTKISVGR